MVELTCCECSRPISQGEDESTYCGSMHRGCLNKHAMSCEVCRNDLKNRSLSTLKRSRAKKADKGKTLPPFWVLLGLHAASHSVPIMAVGCTEEEVVALIVERLQIVRDEHGLEIDASSCRAFNLTGAGDAIWGRLRYWLAENQVVGAEATAIIRATLLEVADSLREAKDEIDGKKK